MRGSARATLGDPEVNIFQSPARLEAELELETEVNIFELHQRYQSQSLKQVLVLAPAGAGIAGAFSRVQLSTECWSSSSPIEIVTVTLGQCSKHTENHSCGHMISYH